MRNSWTGGGPFPGLGRVPAGAGEEGDKGLICALLHKDGLGARHSTLTLLPNPSWSFTARQVSVGSTENRATQK